METILERLLIRAYKADLILVMEAHPEYYRQAIQLAISDKQPYARRAASLLWSCMDENDPHIQGHVKKIILALGTKKDDHQRELLKILLRMEIDKVNEGYLYNFCTSLWESISKKPSVRYTAFRIIIKLSGKHPELGHEIELFTQDHYLESLSPAARKSISIMAKKLTPS